MCSDIKILNYDCLTFGWLMDKYSYKITLQFKFLKQKEILFQKNVSFLRTTTCLVTSLTTYGAITPHLLSGREPSSSVFIRRGIA